MGTTDGESTYKANILQFLVEKKITTVNAPDFPHELLEDNIQLIKYFSANLHLIFHFGVHKKESKREWALNCYLNPCRQ